VRGGVLGSVPSLCQKLFEPGFAVREVGLGDGAGKGDTILVRHLVENIDGGTITQEDALGVNSD